MTQSGIDSNAVADALNECRTPKTRSKASFFTPAVHHVPHKNNESPLGTPESSDDEQHNSVSALKKKLDTDDYFHPERHMKCWKPTRPPPLLRASTLSMGFLESSDDETPSPQQNAPPPLEREPASSVGFLPWLNVETPPPTNDVGKVPLPLHAFIAGAAAGFVIACILYRKN